MKIRVGIIGGGFGVRVHVPAFRRDPRFEVVGLCEREPPPKLRDLAVSKVFTDWRAALDEVDAVSIAVPPAVQAEILPAALARHIHVFCEKPLAHTLDAAREIAETARRSTALHVIDFEFCQVESWKRAKALLREIGPLRHIGVSWLVEANLGVPSWKSRVDQGGGVVANFGSHVFAYLEWFAGPIRALSARTFGLDESGVVFDAEFQTGASVSATLQTQSPSGFTHRVLLEGERGRLTLENLTADYIRGFRLFKGTEVLSQSGPGDEDGRIDAVAGLVRRFGDAVETGRSTSPNIFDGLRAQELIDAARRSRGRWVTLP